MGQKKGQVTVYIIIGIIALLSVSVFFYIRSAKIEAPASYAPTIEQIPLEAEPIRDFVASCVRQVAENGLRSVGDYGGYVSREKMGGTANPFSPTTSDAIQFSPDSDLVVPYWWHLESSNDCEKAGACSFSSKRPNLLRTQGGINIEEQLDDYMNENLKPCLRDFADLWEYGFVISEKGKVDTKTVVTKRTVAFHVRYPIVAEKADVKYEINEYFVDIPINLEEIYNLASTLADLQVEFQFLERYILSLIDGFARIDENRIPPFSATGMDSGGGARWIKSEIESNLNRLMMAYIPMLQVFNTGNYRPILFHEGEEHSLIKKIIYNNLMLVPLVNESHLGLHVKFMYLDWWRPYFDLNCKGELCGPQSVSGIGQIMFFMQRYEFLYDYSIPILVDIVNPHAFFGKGYSFKFFLEANVRDNKPLNTTGIGKLFDTGAIPPVGRTMLCDPNKRTSPEVTVKVSDALSGLGIPEVMISYTCGAETCSMGQTGNDGNLITKFPKCIGGMLKANKGGYLSTGGGVNTATKEEPFTLQITMNPYRIKDIEVRKYLIKKEPVQQNTSSGFVSFSWLWTPKQTSLSLSSKEEAVVTLLRQPEQGELEYSVVAEYTGDRTIEDSSKGVKIIPGTYDVEISLVIRDDITIPADERCDGGFLGIGETCTDLDPVEFTPVKPLYEGGLKRTGMHISAVEMDNADKIIFHAVVIDLAGTPEAKRVHEDLEEINNIEAYSEMYGDLVMPQYEKYEETAARQNMTVTLE